MKLVFYLSPFTAVVLFASFWSLQLAGAPVGDYESVTMLAAIALILALMIAVLQVAALGLIRLLRRQGPTLKVEGGDHLKSVFE